MSFRTSISEAVHLVKNVLAGAKAACGEHDGLTLEISSLNKILHRLRQEASNSKSGINRANKDRKKELEEHVKRCKDILRVLSSVFAKYNSLSDETKTNRKIWQKIKFKNGETKDLADIRQELCALTAAIMMNLNLCSLGSLGKVEARLDYIESRTSKHGHGQQLKGLRKSLHWLAANKAASGGDGSTWTTYTNDDDNFWRELRQDLVKEGYDRTAIKKHKRIIQAYIEELGSRGIFDELEQEEPRCIYTPHHHQPGVNLPVPPKNPHHGKEIPHTPKRDMNVAALSVPQPRIDKVTNEASSKLHHSKADNNSKFGVSHSKIHKQPTVQVPAPKSTQGSAASLEFNPSANDTTGSAMVVGNEPKSPISTGSKLGEPEPDPGFHVSKDNPVVSHPLLCENVVPEEGIISSACPKEERLPVDSKPTADATSPQDLNVNQTSPTKGSENPEAIFPPSSLSSRRKSTTTKQVRFVDLDPTSKNAAKTSSIPKLSRGSTKLPKSIRQARNHFPFNNLSLSNR